MPTPVLAIGKRFLVWIVAAVSGFEALAQLALALWDRDPAGVVVWGITAAVISAFAAFIERVKAVPGG